MNDDKIKATVEAMKTMAGRQHGKSYTKQMLLDEMRRMLYTDDIEVSKPKKEDIPPTIISLDEWR